MHTLQRYTPGLIDEIPEQILIARPVNGAPNRMVFPSLSELSEAYDWTGTVIIGLMAFAAGYFVR